MAENNINEHFLLLLIEKNGMIDTTTITIDNHFQFETITILQLCEGSSDNIIEIIKFINNSLKPKLPNKVFNYCKELDKAYQSVYVNIEAGITDITTKRELIFTNQKNAIKDGKEFKIEDFFSDLKFQIKQTILLWFKVFNLEFAYEKAKKVPSMLVYSHRISGWSRPEYKITENLKQEVKTNFGYGSVSYFYSLLIYKNIQITPLSEWIDYRHSHFSEVIRYTRSFRSVIPVTDENGRVKYFKIKIDNSYWHNALEFTKNAANLSIANENEFIDKFIISECERIVNGLESFYKETEFEFIDENHLSVEEDEIIKRKVDIKGFELIDFRTEKIVGALDFLTKINEYNSIIPTIEYSQRIINLNRKFIPTVYIALDGQNIELKKAKEDYEAFIKDHNQIIKKNEFYQKEKLRLGIDFTEKYLEEYNAFYELLLKSYEDLKHHNHKIKLHSDNIKRLSDFVSKYKEIVEDK